MWCRIYSNAVLFIAAALLTTTTFNPSIRLYSPRDAIPIMLCTGNDLASFHLLVPNPNGDERVGEDECDEEVVDSLPVGREEPAANRRFDSEEALQQHQRDSPAHAQSFDCDDCDRAFDSEKALQQHLQDPRVHHQDTETSLFFCSFLTFDYDPSLPPATLYANLREYQGWRRGSAVSNDAWNRYQDALQSELHMWYGAENDLTAWHALCRAIGIEPLPKTCEQCEKVGDRVTKFGSFILMRIIGCTKDTR